MKAFLAASALLLGATSLHAQAAADVDVSPPEIQLTAGQKMEIAATGYTEAGEVVQGAAFHWSSTDSTVVRVQADSGSDVSTLVAVRPGAAVVEARTGKVRGFATVEVAAGSLPPSPAAPAPDTRPIAESPETAEAKQRLAACSELVKLPATGSWAQWQTSRGSLKLAVLDTESRENKTFYRIELTTSADQGENVVQLLTSSWPNTSLGLAEVVMQPRGRPPVKLTGQRLTAMRSRTPSNPARVAAGRCRQMTDAGMDQVTVPAGTFTARHLRDAEGDYQSWVDVGVPFGLVKAISKGGGDIVLMGSGTGATSAITGTPSTTPARPGRGRAGRAPT